MDIFSAVPSPADHRIHYGPGEYQFGDLRLPAEAAIRFVPLVVFVHGDGGSLRMTWSMRGICALR
jgi:hypothetical protein